MDAGQAGDTDGAMRIIAGTARGRTLRAPAHTSVRPTSDRVRETVFNILGQWLEGERVLDLYAGVGGLGLEAISRGAGHCTFVEQDKVTMAALADNARTLGMADRSTTLLRPVERALRQLTTASASFDLIFADPPYALHQHAALLETLDRDDLVAPGGRVVLEHEKRELLPESVGALRRYDERRYGDTVVSFYSKDNSEGRCPTPALGSTDRLADDDAGGEAG